MAFFETDFNAINYNMLVNSSQIISFINRCQYFICFISIKKLINASHLTAPFNSANILSRVFFCGSLGSFFCVFYSSDS